MTKRYAITFAAILFFTAKAVMAQELTISGTVVDANTGEPLLGAVVRVKETGGGAITDALGKFRLVVKNPVATLSAKLVGYKEKTVVVTQSTDNLVIQLQEDILRAEEVVVTGLATGIRRESAPNSIGTITAKELIPAPAQTLDQAFAGKVPGLSIRQNTGAPGGGISLNLRGITTLQGNTQPLIVIDGVIVSNESFNSGLTSITDAAVGASQSSQDQPSSRLADINPNDIEDIQVLKGPAATAVYGSKAAAGVLVITTKQGKPGDTRIDVSQQIGFNSVLKLQGTRDWRQDSTGLRAAFGQAGVDAFVRSGGVNGQYIDYEREFYGQNGLINETSITARGGSATTLFTISGQARNDQGIIRHTYYNRYAVRSNLTHRFSDRLTADIGLNYVNSNSQRSATGNANVTLTSIGYAMTRLPSFLDVRQRPDGTFPVFPFAPSNPAEIIERVRNEEYIDRLIGSFRLDFNVFRMENQSLNFIASGGADYISQRNVITSPVNTQHEQAKAAPGENAANNVTNFFNNLWLSAVHNVSFSNIAITTSAGFQIENRDNSSILVNVRGLTADLASVGLGVEVTQQQTITRQYDQGFYIQSDIDFGGVGFLNVKLRGDRSSVNSDVNQFYLFPGAGASIILSKFDFWKGISNTIDYLKLRAAVGQAGTLAPPESKFLSFVPANVTGLIGALVPLRNGNDNVRPERTTEIEFGFDAGILNGLASLEFTYFLRNIDDLILLKQLPPSSGFTSQLVNAGAMRTFGIEAALTVNAIRSREVDWTARVIFSRNRAEITRLDVPPFQRGGFGVNLGAYTIRQGYSPFSIVGRESFGPNPNAPNPNARPGEFNGLILGDEQPDFNMGFSNSLRVYGFELFFLFDWRQGNKVINLSRFLTDGTGISPDVEAARERVRARATSTAPYVEDGSFIKLRELSLTYTLDPELTRSFFGGAVSYLRIGIAGRNLLMFTRYSSYDPEVSNFGNLATAGSIEVTPFPSSRSFFFNIQFGL
ncbi:MAG: SusC/RagA family TonB-linked outer membrane protein [Chloroherpetonaceae bacterium]|nr:SusC/RagA family TonB-linked outer membrane protein [Chloroherpetonaceae bacterium]MCS7210956.1 SusC/RagA family TonB-linked outer membrane protein [Chloroherpetonaceae bacterium]